VAAWRGKLARKKVKAYSTRFIAEFSENIEVESIEAAIIACFTA
jgi:hypothetical protein